MKTVVHIGYFKCGSSALQQYLAVNGGLLERSKVLYPKASRARLNSHSALAFMLYHEADRPVAKWFRRTKVWKKRVPFADMASAVAAERDASSADLTVLSSEEFVRCGAFDNGAEVVRRFADTLATDEVQLIVYLRRPDRYIVSWYGQLLRLGAGAAELPEALPQYLDSIHVDYLQALEPWIDVFGSNALQIRNYEELVQGDIVADFGEAIGRDISGGVRLSEVNVGIPRALYGAVRRSNAGSKQPKFRRLRMRAIAELKTLPAGKEMGGAQVEILGPDARQQLYDRFSPINDRLGEIAGRPNGFFENLIEMTEVPEGSMTASEADQKYGHLLDTAIMAQLASELS